MKTKPSRERSEENLAAAEADLRTLDHHVAIAVEKMGKKF